MLIIHLMLHKWTNEPPYPAFKTLAKRMGISDTAVRGHARSLEFKKYLKRQKRVNDTNLFYLEPLFDALEKMRAADLKTKEEHEKKKTRAAG